MSLYTAQSLLFYAPILDLIQSFLLPRKPIDKASILDRIHARCTCKVWHKVIREHEWPDTYRLSVKFTEKRDFLSAPSYIVQILSDYLSNTRIFTSYQSDRLILPPDELKTRITNAFVTWPVSGKRYSDETRQIMDYLDPNAIRSVYFRGMPIPHHSWNWMTEYVRFAPKFTITNHVCIGVFDYVDEWNTAYLMKETRIMGVCRIKTNTAESYGWTTQEAHAVMVDVLCTGRYPDEPDTNSTES
jgi:hypothetical protein